MVSRHLIDEVEDELWKTKFRSSEREFCKDMVDQMEHDELDPRQVNQGIAHWVNYLLKNDMNVDRDWSVGTTLYNEKIVLDNSTRQGVDIGSDDQEFYEEFVPKRMVLGDFQTGVPDNIRQYCNDYRDWMVKKVADVVDEIAELSDKPKHIVLGDLANKKMKKELKEEMV